jgi:hypothetical protein
MATLENEAPRNPFGGGSARDVLQLRPVQRRIAEIDRHVGLHPLRGGGKPVEQRKCEPCHAHRPAMRGVEPGGTVGRNVGERQARCRDHLVEIAADAGRTGTQNAPDARGSR